MRVTPLKAALAAGVSLAAIIPPALMSTALAGGFGVREQSARGQGLSFAGAAAGGAGLGSMYWNPAAVTLYPGHVTSQNLTGIFPDSVITPGAGTSPLLLPGGGSGNLGIDALVPSGYDARQINDRVWLGVSSNAPFGLRTDPAQVWSGEFLARSSKAFSLNVAPTIGVRVTDWLTVGFGVQAQYLDVKVKSAVPVLARAGSPAFLSGAPTAIIQGDDIGFGITAGVLLTPFVGTQIGLGYRSSIHHELHGKLKVETGSPFTTSAIPIEAKVNLPEIVTLGLAQEIGGRFTLLAGVEWTNWSRVGEIGVVNKLSRAPVRGLPFHYEDGFFFSGGAEFHVDPRWTVRTGLAYEISPVEDQVRSLRIPDNDRVWLSAGASYKWSEKLSFDLGYTHIFVADTSIAIVPGHPDFVSPALQFVGRADSSVDILSFGINYRFGEVEPAREVRPVREPVRKF